MLYAAFEDIKTRECADFLSVTLGITGIIGKTERVVFILNCLCGIILITFNIFRRNKNRIGGGDVKFCGAVSLVLGFF